MAGCDKGCGKGKVYPKLQQDLDILESRSGFGRVPKELVYAVAVQESDGNRWFDRKDLLYKQNMAVAVKGWRMSERKILDDLVATEGPTRGLIPKFRFEPDWYVISTSHATKSDRMFYWSRILSTSFGYCQKGMVWYLTRFPAEEWERKFRAFLLDPYLQLKVCAGDLENLIHNTNGDIPLALTRYNGPSKARRVSNYGEKVYAHFMEKLKQNQQGG